MNEGQCYHCLNLIGCCFISRDCRNFDFVGNNHIESQSVLSLSCEVQLQGWGFLSYLYTQMSNDIHNHKFEFSCCLQINETCNVVTLYLNFRKQQKSTKKWKRRKMMKRKMTTACVKLEMASIYQQKFTRNYTHINYRVYCGSGACISKAREGFLVMTWGRCLPSQA